LSEENSYCPGFALISNNGLFLINAFIVQGMKLNKWSFASISPKPFILQSYVLFWQKEGVSSAKNQGCQMVCFQTKKFPIWVHFGGPYLDWKMFLYFMATWNILWRFGIFYDHLVHFVFIWYFFLPFWYNEPRKIWQPC
jgi:hypothetical protein